METEGNSTHSTRLRSVELDIPETDGGWQVEESFPKLRFMRISKPHSKKRMTVSVKGKKWNVGILIRREKCN